MQQSRAKRSIIMIFRLLKKDQYRQVTRLVSGLRSPFVDQSTPSLAAKGKIVLLTFWDRYKLNLQWKKTRRVSYLCEIWKYKPYGSKHYYVLWHPLYILILSTRELFWADTTTVWYKTTSGRKKHPRQWNIDTNGLVFKHSTVNLIHEKQHSFHWTFHIVYLHSQRWAFCNSFSVWEFHVDVISAVTIICNRVKWCDLVPNPSVHSFTPTLRCIHLLHDILSAISFWIE